MAILSDIELGDYIVVSRKVFTVNDISLHGDILYLMDDLGRELPMSTEELDFIGAYPLYNTQYKNGLIMCGSEIPLLPRGTIIANDYTEYEVCEGIVVDRNTYFSIDIWTFAEMTYAQEYTIKELAE